MLTRERKFGSLWSMGRPKRADEGDLIYHVLNRANARMTIFEKDGDYEAFERVLREAVDRANKTVGLLRHAEPLAPHRLAPTRL